MIRRASALNRPSFCVYSADEALFERFAGVAAALRDRHRRFAVVLMAGDPAIRGRLARRWPDATILGPPAGRGHLGAGWVRRLKVKCFIVLDGLEEAEGRVFPMLKRRAVPIVALTEPAAAASRHPLAADHYIVGESAALQRLRAAGIDAGRVTVVEGLTAPQGIGASVAARIVEVLTPFLARRGAVARSRRPRPWHRLEAMLLRRLSPSRIRRLESVGALRDALGTPQRILCLGNGPSSEDTALREVKYDCLFRVNDRWLDRGFLAEPDMVFTGSKKTLRKVRGAIFGLSSIEIEPMLLRNWLRYAFYRRLTYFTPERAGLLRSDPAEGFELTNGAIMLATAVALAPGSLVVAGIDLFSDPRGAYPGDDDDTPNAYAAAHERNSESQFIMEILSAYRGELLILGDALKAHWTTRRLNRAVEAR
jgi:hypothetical protein